MSDSKKRLVNWDLLRSLAMLFVVIVHTSYSVAGEVAWGSSDWPISRIINTITFICDPVFFMLSGFFAFKPSKRSLKDYYLNKVSTIILPLVLYSIILYLFKNKLDIASMSLDGYFLNFANQLSTGLWFIPTLIPCLMVAPFLAKGMDALSDKNVLALCAVIMAISAWGLCMGFFKWIGDQAGVETLVSFSTMSLTLIPPGALTTSLLYFQFFIMGGVFRRLAPRLRGKTGTIMIAVGMLFWIQDVVFAALYIPRADPSYSWMFVSFGIMIIFDRIKISAKVPSVIINWTAKRSYSIYIFQYSTIAFSLKAFYELSILGDVSEMGAALRILMWVVSTLAAYLLALVLASIGDTLLLSNLQKLFNRLVHRNVTGNKADAGESVGDTAP